jgi:hypothetical protein
MATATEMTAAAPSAVGEDASAVVIDFIELTGMTGPISVARPTSMPVIRRSLIGSP